MRWHLFILAATVAVTACSSRPLSDRSAGDDPSHSVFVVRRELHTGIVIRAADWPDRSWTVLTDFPDATYLEFGWGDAVYYQAERKTLAMTLAAVFWPTPSVMEVFASADVRKHESSDYQLTEIHLTPSELRTLAASITASFAGRTVTPTGVTREIAGGGHRFYAANGKFHLFRMCNRWTAEQLASVGCQIGRWPVFTASRVLHEAQRCEHAYARRSNQLKVRDEAREEE